MTIGEKITALRISKNISQEELAARLAVSRQAVSRWEIGKALPQVDKIIQLAEIFGTTTDTLLLDKNEIRQITPKRNKYFGTDGFRGTANIGLTSMHAYRVGRFLGWYYSKIAGTRRRPKIVIGKDTRRSSYTLEYSIVAGITASGADAYMLHVTTTPSVSYVTRQDEFDCGIMITASHNPFDDNGIKVINRYGEKLEDSVTELIEAYLDGDMAALGLEGDLPFATGEKIGAIIDYVAGRNRYVAYLISLASHSYKHLRIGLDTANGASWMIARAVFSALGADVELIGDAPDGINVNRGCGSTHIEALCRLVTEKHLDFGFAFDGDADRCIAVGGDGKVIDGDAIMYILARRLKARGMLNRNTVVATVMSNSGFVESLKEIGIGCEVTKVGDRYVYEKIRDCDFSLGGEQSGHIIIKKYATTGDGILTAIMLSEEICDTKSTLGELSANLHLYPQYLENIRVRDKKAARLDEGVILATQSIEKKIGGRGRVLLRESGTEPLIRIMIECENEELCRQYAKEIADAIKAGGHAVE